MLRSPLLLGAGRSQDTIDMKAPMDLHLSNEAPGVDGVGMEPLLLFQESKYHPADATESQPPEIYHKKELLTDSVAR